MDRKGLTLMELMMVLAVLAALAGLLVPMLSTSTDTARVQVTMTSMQRIRDAIVGSPERPGYQSDVETLPEVVSTASQFDWALAVPPTMGWLFHNPPPNGEHSLTEWDPKLRRGWRGPYFVGHTGRYPAVEVNGFSAAYGQPNEFTILDGWGNPIVIQWPVSAADPARKDPAVQRLVRLLSAGPDGKLETQMGGPRLGDDITLNLYVPEFPED